MNTGKLMGLAVAAVAALGIALWLSGERAPVREVDVGTALIPGLEAGLNNITQISIRNAEAGTTLVRNDQTWGVAERSGYPADVAKLREQLIKLARAKLLEPKTANPANYARLGVEDPMSPEAGGVMLSIDGVGDPIHLVIGDYTARAGDGTYVRFVDKEQSWLAGANLSLDAEVAGWLTKEVMNISSDRIAAVRLTYPDENSLKISKANADETNYSVEALPDGRELTSDSAPNSIANALSSLRLDDVRDSADVDLATEAVTTSVYETFDGLRITASGFESEDKRFVAFEVAFADELIPAEEPADEAETEGEADGDGDGEGEGEGEESGDNASELNALDESASQETRAEIVARVQAEAQALQEKVNGWVFEVPSYKYTNLTKPVEELLKPLEESADEAG